MDEPVTLYVSGLPLDFDDIKLKTLFSDFGTIVSCICEYPKPGKWHKYGFVKYSTLAEAENCLRLYKTIPLSIRVNLSKENSGQRDNFKYMTSNMSYGNAIPTMFNKSEIAIRETLRSPTNPRPFVTFPHSPRHFNSDDFECQTIELPGAIQHAPINTHKVVTLNPISGQLTISFNNPKANTANNTLYPFGGYKKFNYFNDDGQKTDWIDGPNKPLCIKCSSPVHLNIQSCDNISLGNSCSISPSGAAKPNSSSRRTSIKNIIDNKPLRKPYAFALNKLQNTEVSIVAKDTSSVLNSEIIEPLPRQSLMAGDQVIVSFGNTPSSFYVHKVTECKELSAIVEKLNLESKPKKGFKPTISCICFAKSDDGNCYRARVEKILSNNQCLVFFVDFGNSEIIDVSNLGFISDEFRRSTAKAYCLRLLNIKPINGLPEFSTQCLEKFCDIIYSGTFVVRKVASFVDDKFTVQLEDPEGNNLSERLIKDKIADPVAKYLLEKPLKELKSLVNKNLTNQMTQNRSEQNYRNKISIDRYKTGELKSPVNIPVPSQMTRDKSDLKQKLQNQDVHDSTPKIDMINVRDHVAQANTEKVSSTTTLKLAVQNLSVGDKIALVYGDDPHYFFLQKFSDVNELQIIATRLQSMKIEPFNNSLSVGSLCAAKYTDGLWYRAKIQQIVNGKFNVFFLDYGNSEVVLASEISSLLEELSFSPMAYCCRLIRVKPLLNQNKFSQEVKDKFTSLLSEYLFIIQDVTQKEEVFEVELAATNKAGTTLSDMLLNMKLVDLTIAHCVPKSLEKPETLVQYSDVLQQVMIPLPTSSVAFSAEKSIREPFEFSMLPKQNLYLKEIVTLCFGDDPRQFYVHKTSAQEDLEFITSALQSEINNAPKVINPKIGHMCCAKFEDGAWYRAKIAKDLGNGSIEIFFLDFGNVEIAAASDLATLPGSVQNFPAQAYLLSLNISPLGQAKEFPTETKEAFVALISEIPLIVKHSFEIESSVDNRTSFVVDMEDEEGNDIAQLLVANHLGETVDLPKSSKAQVETEPKSSISDTQVVINKSDEKLTIFNEEIAKNTITSHDSKISVENYTVIPLDISVLPKQTLQFEEQVVFCFGEDPRQFYVQKLSNIEDLKFITKTLQTEISKASTIVDPKVDHLCCAKFEDDAWYRTKIAKDLGNGNVEVSFLDFGNVEIYSHSSLLTLPPKVLNFPPLAYLLTLNVSPLDQAKDFPRETQEAFVALISEIPLIVKHSFESEYSFLVDLEDEEGNNIAQLLVANHVAEAVDVPISSKLPKEVEPILSKVSVEVERKLSSSDTQVHTNNSDEKFIISKEYDKTTTSPNTKILVEISTIMPVEFCVLPKQTLQIEDQVVFCFGEDPRKFYVQKLSNIEDFKFITKTLQTEISKASTIVDPKVGHLCCAKFEDDVWYRTKIAKDLGNGNVEVSFLDFGNVEIYSHSSLLTLSQKVLNFPPLAYLLTLNVSPLDQAKDFPRETKEAFVTLISEIPLIVKHSLESESSFLVDLEDEEGNDIAQLLVANHVAEALDVPISSNVPVQVEPILTKVPVQVEPILTKVPVQVEPILSKVPEQVEPILSKVPEQVEPILSKVPVEVEPILSKVPVEVEPILSKVPVEVEPILSKVPVEVEPILSKVPVEVEPILSKVPVEVEPILSKVPVEVEPILSKVPVEVEPILSKVPVEVELILSKVPVEVEPILSKVPVEVERELSSSDTQVHINKLDEKFIIYDEEIAKNTITNHDSKVSVENSTVMPVDFSVLPKQTLQSEEQIVFCFGEDPRQFYVQKLSNIEDLKFITKTLQTEISKATTIVDPKIDHLCCAKFEDDVWYRTKIAKDLGNGNVEVSFLDFGNVEIYSHSSLLTLSQKVLNFPPLAYLLTLNVSPLDQAKDFPRETKEAFVTLISEIPLIVKHSLESESSFLVDLEDEEGNDIAQLLVANHVAEAVTVLKENEVLPKSYTENPQAIFEKASPDSKEIEFKKTLSENTQKPSEVKQTNTKEISTDVQIPTPSHDEQIISELNTSRNVSQVLNNLPDQNLCVGDKISLIHNSDPCHFFVHKLSELEILVHITTVLQNEMEKSQTFAFTPKMGLLCSAKYIDLAWYRARIEKELVNGNFEVFFLDFGNVEELSALSLYNLPSELYSFPEMAYCLKLKVCPLNDEVKFSSELKDIFYSFINEFPLIVNDVKKEGSSFVVELIDEEGNNIAELLISNNLAQAMSEYTTSIHPQCTEPSLLVPANCIKPIEPAVEILDKPNETVKPSLEISLPKQCLKLEEQVMLCHGNDPMNFYVLKLSDTDKLSTIAEVLQNSVVQYEDTTKITVGSLCSAKFEDGVWYRAKVEKVIDGSVEIYFLDYGNKATIDISCLSHLPEQLLAYPTLAYRLKLKVGPIGNLNDFAQEVKDAFLSLLDGIILVVKAVSKSTDENCFTVEMKDSDGNDIADLLVANQMARPLPTHKVTNVSKEDMPKLLNVPSKYKISSLTDNSPKVENSSDKSYFDQKSGQNNDICVISSALPFIPFCIGSEETVNVTHVSQQNFYVQKKSDKEHIERLMTNIQKFCYNRTGIEKFPKEGDLLSCCFTDGIWYRVQIMSAKKINDIEVFFLDFGNKDKVSMKDLKPFPQQGLKFPPYAYSVCFKGQVCYSEELKRLLMNENWKMNVVGICSSLSKTALVELKNESEITNKILRSKIIP